MLLDYVPKELKKNLLKFGGISKTPASYTPETAPVSQLVLTIISLSKAVKT